jgi:WD40 repeat protein
MRTVQRIVTLLGVALLPACAGESDGNIAGALATSRASSFSAWSEPVSLGPLINTASNDQQAMLSKDGLTLYFASNRPGSLGALDIWVAQRADREAPWSQPVNLGPPVNTSFSEFAPALSRDEHWLFIATSRPVSFGSNDIWASYRENVHDDFGWQAPVNLGSGINTTGFEGGPAYFANDELGGAQLYYNHNDEPVNTGGDIYVSTQAADGSWGLGTAVAELNTAASEQRPSVGHSGLDIYMFSNRSGSLPDGTGAMTTDIWFSTRASVLDPWSTPTNVGPPISSGLPEVHPFIFSHGGIEELYFGRTVPGSGNDLFVSRRTRGDRTGAP